MSRKKSKSQSRGKPGTAVLNERKRKEGKPSPPDSPDEAPQQPLLSAAGMREVVESVVIAFVLAFLFRTFEAEAFVIPTGSMAPTLLGRHKDVECPECGYHFQISASDEIDNTTGQLTGRRVVSGTCPMCRYTMDLRPSNPEGESYRSYKGDRILVTKFAYRFGDPGRWEVAVFKYPGGAKTNFIKRIVGLPNETISISHGDLFVKPAEADDFSRFGDPYYRYRDVPIDLERFEIARKPPDKILATLQPVYDNDCVLPEHIKLGWPMRWSPLAGPESAAGWQTSEDFCSLSTDGTAEGEVWVVYRHIVPSFEDWESLKDGVMPPDNPAPRPQLITDFTAYNTEVATPDSAPALSGRMLGLHWVGDLAIECTMQVESASGEAIFELVEGGRLFQCRIDVATGQATLSVDGVEAYRPTATTCVRGPGSYRIMFANIDDQLLLWVNGKVVRFDQETSYPRLENTRPDEADLQPVRIGSRGAALQLRHLKIHRDIYYIAHRLGRESVSSDDITDFDNFAYRYPSRQEVARVFSDPREWTGFRSARQVAFPLGEDQFLVLGDNSAESKDSRLWESEGFPHYVPRDLLMGKALFIYWPHSLDTIPYTSIPVRFFPNFWRMQFVR